MKQFFLFLLAITIAGCNNNAAEKKSGSNSNDYSSLKEQKLKGRVKKKHTITLSGNIYSKFDEWELSDTVKGIIIIDNFDAAGNLSHSQYTRPPYIDTYSVKYVYENGKPSSEEGTYKGNIIKNGAVKWLNDSTYIKTIVSISDTPETETKIKLNNSFAIVGSEELSYNSEKIDNQTFTKYHDSGYITNTTWHSEPELKMTLHYLIVKRDKTGNPEKIIITEEGKDKPAMLYQISYEYY
jgi:hypothetical protein